MKKVIILGHFWPYHPRGSKRMLGLAKYLPEFGWQPIIVTEFLQQKPEKQFRIIETSSRNTITSLKKRLFLDPHQGLQKQIGIPASLREKRQSITTKILKLIEGLITYPDIEKGWKPFVLKAVAEVFQKEKISALMSVWPLASHLIAQDLKNQYQIPWVADFPDLWSQGYGYHYGRLRKTLDTRLEKKTLKLADALTTSCWPQAKILRKLHPGKYIRSIMIGYDPERINRPASKLTKKLTISYTGLWQGEERHPLKLFQGLKELITQQLIQPQDIEVRFYGPKSQWLDNKIKEYGLANMVKQFGIVPWEECLQKQRESQILLHLNWEEVEERGVFSGKLPEYLAARRPILAAGGINQDEVVKAILSQTKAGVYCPWVKDIKRQLLRFYSEYKQKGYIPYQADLQKVKQYSYKKMAKKFAKILNLVSKKNSLTNLFTSHSKNGPN